MASQSDSVSSRFFEPIQSLLPECSHLRQCPVLSDEQWIELGVGRVIEAPASGRGFLQNLVSEGRCSPSYSHFFETLKSKRRLNLCDEVNDRVIQNKIGSLDDALSKFQELEGFACLHCLCTLPVCTLPDDFQVFFLLGLLASFRFYL